IWPWLQDIAQDVRFAARMLARDRRFTAAAAVALALGIGVNTSAFTIVNAALLRALPFAAPDRLVSVRTHDPRGGALLMSYLDFRDWRAGARSFADMAGEVGTAMNVSDEARSPERF